MPDLLPITVQDMVTEIEREISMRREVYPKRVAAGSMRQIVADRRIEVMQAILRKLRHEQPARD